MWESATYLMDWCGVCQKTTGNNVTLEHCKCEKAKREKNKARYCGIARIDVIEQLIGWDAPEVTGTEKALRCESARQSIVARREDLHHAIA